MKRAFLLVIAALGACSRPDAVAENAKNTDALPTVNTGAPSPTGAAPAEGAQPGNAVEPAASKIPPALQGRWGLTPGDCTSAIGDAKGLLVINSDELRFYESRAVPAADVQTSDDSISGDFAFTGEGRTWTKHVSLESRDGKLVRTERDPLATFSYVRCG